MQLGEVSMLDFNSVFIPKWVADCTIMTQKKYAQVIRIRQQFENKAEILLSAHSRISHITSRCISRDLCHGGGQGHCLLLPQQQHKIKWR